MARYTKRETRIFVRCMIAQLLNGRESLAHGPANCRVKLYAAPRYAGGTVHYGDGNRLTVINRVLAFAVMSLFS